MINTTAQPGLLPKTPLLLAALPHLWTAQDHSRGADRLRGGGGKLENL